jgi:hypothetical protein
MSAHKKILKSVIKYKSLRFTTTNRGLSAKSIQRVRRRRRERVRTTHKREFEGGRLKEEAKAAKGERRG